MRMRGMYPEYFFVMLFTSFHSNTVANKYILIERFLFELSTSMNSSAAVRFKWWRTLDREYDEFNLRYFINKFDAN